ncbi:hypothetical protein SPONN_2077 [uncultured Candidatus Thioglobus sp.]|nr:hypothetical protein SPONN_2077 [uncultured Candidatus Thioglobus sp.]
MTALIDANVIIRFSLDDHPVLSKKSNEIFSEIKDNTLQVEILDSVLMEVFFVLNKTYKIDREKVLIFLKRIIAFSGIVGDKHISLEALNVMQTHNIDYVDALICAKHHLQGYEKISFDNETFV